MLGWSSGEARTDVSELRTKRSDESRMASTGLRLWLKKLAVVWSGAMPQSEMPLCFATSASILAETTSRLFRRTLTTVSEAMTEAISAMALAPSTPSLQPAMPMLTMLLPFIAAMSSSEDAWSKSV